MRKNPCDRKKDEKYIRDVSTREEVSDLFQFKMKLPKKEFLTFYERENGTWEVRFMTRGFFDKNLNPVSSCTASSAGSRTHSC